MSAEVARESTRSLARKRRTLAALFVIALALAAVVAVRWIWRDITYWSRSVTFAHGTASLGTCLPLALAALPGVSIRPSGEAFQIELPGQEGALVKPTPDAGVARIVIYGHSASVSTLGPPAEEPVAAALQALKSAFSASCASP
jgi:hypothetical protein